MVITGRCDFITHFLRALLYVLVLNFLNKIIDAFLTNDSPAMGLCWSYCMVLLHFDKILVRNPLRRPINIVSRSRDHFICCRVRCQLVLWDIPVINLLPLLLSWHDFVSKRLGKLSVSLLIVREMRSDNLWPLADRLEVTRGHSLDWFLTVLLLAHLHSHFRQEHGSLTGSLRWWIQYWRT